MKPFFADVIGGWTVSADQSAADKSGLRASDLQIAKYNSGFAMVHRMGLANIKMAGSTAANSKETITLTANTTNTAYSSSTTNNAFYALDEFVTNLPYKDGTRNTSSLNCFFIVNPTESYTFSTSYKYADADANRQWNNITISSSSNTIANGNYREITTSTPKFKNLGRLYSYTGACQTYTPTLAGFKYKMECWGAQGATGDLGIGGSEATDIAGGMGGYTKGSLRITNNITLYLYVGGTPSYNNYSGGWNGGGKGTTNDTKTGGIHSQKSYGGGGATDIRLSPASESNNTIWNEENSLYTRIMVAGGGAGPTAIPGSGGGLYGNDGGDTSYPFSGYGSQKRKYKGTVGVTYLYYDSIPRVFKTIVWTESSTFEIARVYLGTGGTQTGGGNSACWCEILGDEDDICLSMSRENQGGFGYGGENKQYVIKDGVKVTAFGAPGGGGGWYGGGAANRSHGGGGGGSSFISGHTGCNGVNSSTKSHRGASTSSIIDGTTYTFSNTTMIDGEGKEWTTASQIIGGSVVGMPLPTASSGIENGHAGSGYARITCTPYD